MSVAQTGIPPQIEQQLLALDQQLRMAAFTRGIGRLVFLLCAALGGCLLVDCLLDLSSVVRAGLLAGWIGLAILFLWFGLARKVWRPISYSALAAIIERQYPELRERLTSLVELRDTDASELAPGASKVMQELLTRQTLKAFDQVSMENVDAASGAAQAVFRGLTAFVVLLAPFCLFPDTYSLLWARFLHPCGNHRWGTWGELDVVEGDQVAARGADVAVHARLLRGSRAAYWANRRPTLWLNWADEQGASDSRRLDWEEESEQFSTILPHVQSSVKYTISTDGAKSKTYRIDVSDPPTISALTVDVEPAAYTGLPAQRLMSLPLEMRVPEFTRLRFHVECSDPVATAEFSWPSPPTTSENGLDEQASESKSANWIPMELSSDRRSATVNVTATQSGGYSVRLTNDAGLANEDQSRTVFVSLDQPPQFQVDANDDSVYCRPDELVELPVDVVDDFGLTAVELQLDTGRESPVVLGPSDKERLETHFVHTFVVDVSSLDLKDKKLATFRFRAVDNRPTPGPQVTWTAFRSLIISNNASRLSDPQLSRQQDLAEEELSRLRSAVNQLKTDIAKLHQQTEKEALNKQPETDKSGSLDQFMDSVRDIDGQLKQFADLLAERPMTKDLSPFVLQVAETDLRPTGDKLAQAKGQTPRDQLEPLASSIDQLGIVDRQLRKLEQQLHELHKLEQDVADLKRLAAQAERLADQLDKVDPEHTDPQVLEQLKAGAQKLDDQMSAVFTKHPELIDAARRGQLDRFKKLVDQAEKVVQPQEKLAQALQSSIKNDSPPESAEKNSDSAAKDQREREAGQTATAEQAAIGKNAAEQALQLALEVGADSNATKSAAEFARQADEARQRAEAGNLTEAAEAANQAAQSAQETAKQLNPDGESDSAQSKKAAELAGRQQANAQKLAGLAKSPSAQRGSQAQGQQQLASTTQQLAEQMGRVAKMLESSPVKSPQDAAAADEARQKLEEARKSMDDSAIANMKNDPKRAAQQASEATEKLKQVAQASPPARQPTKSTTPVPKEVGNQLTEMKDRLESAQQKLSQCQCSGGNSGSSSSAGTSSQGQAGSSSSAAPKPANGDSSPGPMNSAEASPSSSQNGSPSGQSGSTPSSASPAVPSNAKQETAGNGSEGKQPQPREPFGKAADQFRQFAALLKQPLQDPNGQAAAGMGPGQSLTGGEQESPTAMSLESPHGVGAGGVNVGVDLSHLDAELQQQARQNWGRLPGKLRTEILQGANKKSHPEYLRQIKAYFEEITKPNP